MTLPIPALPEVVERRGINSAVDHAHWAHECSPSEIPIDIYGGRVAGGNGCFALLDRHCAADALAARGKTAEEIARVLPDPITRVDGSPRTRWVQAAPLEATFVGALRRASARWPNGRFARNEDGTAEGINGGSRINAWEVTACPAKSRR